MSAETPTAELEPVVAQEVAQEEANIPEVQQEEEVQQVPLKTLQKERRKRQDSESRTKLLEEQMAKLMTQGRQEAPVDDSSKYETVTRGDLDSQRSVDKAEIIRTVREEEWKEKNIQNALYIDEHLQELLDEKPHLAYAISNSKNRYQEAWDQLRGHGKLPNTEVEKREPVKRAAAPNSPANMPKSAGVNQTVDVMNMNDREFSEWRNKQIKRR